MPSTPRLRSACDACHELKVRCSGNLPCQGCAESGYTCVYSFSNRLGRPPGAKNKRNGAASSSKSSAPPPSNRPTMKVPPQQLMVATANGSEGQAWSANRPKGRRRQRSQPAAAPAPPTPQQQLTPPLSTTRSEIQSIHPTPTDTTSVCIGASDGKDMSWDSNIFGVSGFLGGDWRGDGMFGSGSKDAFEYGGMLFDDPSAASTRSPASNPPSLDMFQSIPTGSMASSTSGDLPMDEFINGFSQPMVHPVLSESSHINECSCLQQNTELLCSLKRSKMIRSPLQSDGNPTNLGASSCLSQTLLNVQEAFRVWQDMINCRSCAHNDDHEVLLLALMCIRAVLSRLQVVNWGEGGASLSDSGDASNHCSPAKDPQQPITRKKSRTEPTSMDTSDAIKIVVGEFEVTGDDKHIVLQVLRSVTLRKMELTLGLLSEILERKKSLEKTFNSSSHMPDRGGSLWAEQRHSAGNLAYAEQMLQGLVAFVKGLQDSSRS